MPPEQGWPVFVLSLADGVARRAPLLARLAEAGISCEVIPALDGRAGLPAEAEALIDRDAARRRMGRPMRDAEFACALSHLGIYRLIAERRLAGAVILEDDAVPLPGFAAFLAAGAHRRAPFLQFCYGSARVMRGTEREAIPGVVTYELALPAALAVAYSVSAPAAAALLRAATPVAATADWPCDTTRLGARIVVPKLVHHPTPSVVPSTIGGARRARDLGLPDPKKRLSRFVRRDYWRRWWRKRGSFWLPEEPGPA
ncbi:MAG: glycosyltransferase family 25 protein [Acetobacteraceae bacterium]|nr:glycosyltransferase family 25 protein [Acetobacteraceae bacterium]